ncbi:MAG TPA: SPOR domain-containing protein, partial [Edaphobacter sp.]|nr:SPOR domain-containing protein [Edaphobacter sp.]
VQELAALLLQAMTGRRSLQGSATMLTPPFDGIIRNGLSGKWGLSEMATALGPVAKPQEPATPAPTPAVQKAEARPQAAAANVQKTEAQKASSAGPLFDKAETSKAVAAPGPAASRTTAASEAGTARPLTQTHAPDVRHRIVRPVEQEPKRLKMIAVIAIAALVLLAVGWYFLRNGTSPAPEAATTAPATRPVRPATPPAPVAAAAPAPTEADTAAPVRTGRTEWRVVAFTYNHQDQAQKKADELRAKHPAMNPEVFSPRGRAPYLVTVGGAMTRDQAIAFRAKARGAGLPRDTYARNYSR